MCRIVEKRRFLVLGGPAIVISFLPKMVKGGFLEKEAVCLRIVGKATLRLNCSRERVQGQIVPLINIPFVGVKMGSAGKGSGKRVWPLWGLLHRLNS